MTNPTHLYVGLRDAVKAEVGTPDYYKGKYLLQPYGEHEWDAEGANNKKELKITIAYYREIYPGIQIVSL